MIFARVWSVRRDRQGGLVGVADILQQIDQEIAQLQRARALLHGSASKTTKASVTGAARSRKKKRNLTPEGRRRIAEAVKRRWERQRKAVGGK
jgi:hypothetical protein